jgi:hypothetical protein
MGGCTAEVCAQAGGIAIARTNPTTKIDLGQQIVGSQKSVKAGIN